MSVESFIEQHLDEMGELTPEQSATMLNMALHGDTADVSTSEVGTQADSSEPPTATEEKQGSPANVPDTSVDKPNLDNLTADNAVIMAKDGKHTIPFEKLQQARESERLAQLQAQQATAELEKLREQMAQSNTPKEQAKLDNQIDIAQQAIDSGFDPKIFGDFDEEGLTKGINTLLAQRTAEIEKQFEQKLQQALQPVAQKQQLDETQSHYQAIMEAHPDVESMADSQEFANWIGSQPSYAQQAIMGVLQQGTTRDVIEVLNNFKATQAPSPTTQPDKPTTDLKQVAQQQIANTKPNVPSSLSDISGGRAEPSSPEERIANASSVDMLSEMQNWSPEQIEQFLNKGL